MATFITSIAASTETPKQTYKELYDRNTPIPKRRGSEQCSDGKFLGYDLSFERLTNREWYEILIIIQDLMKSRTRVRRELTYTVRVDYSDKLEHLFNHLYQYKMNKGVHLTTVIREEEPNIISLYNLKEIKFKDIKRNSSNRVVKNAKGEAKKEIVKGTVEVNKVNLVVLHKE